MAGTRIWQVCRPTVHMLITGDRILTGTAASRGNGTALAFVYAYKVKITRR